jgi:transcriptional regulator with XRE-family HTH domain
MTNERLRTALLQRGQTPATVAEVLGVDPKTVERWIGGRTPYRRTRYQLARHLEADEAFLWPNAISDGEQASISHSEFVGIHPHRWAVPRDVWARLLESAQEEIGILVYSGMFFAEDRGFLDILLNKATQGVRVRILIGDPNSSELRERGTEEGLDELLAAKVRNAVVLMKPLWAVDGVEIRLHGTTLYNSIYRADEELLVNPHIYGVPAARAPVLHLRQVPGGTMVSTYLESFERVWATARPLTPGT